MSLPRLLFLVSDRTPEHWQEALRRVRAWELDVQRVRGEPGARPPRSLERSDLVLLCATLGADSVSAWIEEIMGFRPRPLVVLAPSPPPPEAVRRWKERGALWTLEGPLPGAPVAPLRERLLESLKVPVVVHPRPTRRWLRRSLPSAQEGSPADEVLCSPPPGPLPQAVVVASSAGGPRALSRLLGALPASFPTPLLVVQHMGADFLDHLAADLSRAGPLDARVVREQGRRPQAGLVHLAADGSHLVVDPTGCLRLVAPDPHDQGHVPSADRLFASAAAAYGPRLVAVVLSGMGEDGARGARAVKRAGGAVYAQDAASSVVFGMPRAAERLGVVDALLSPEGIARALAQHCAVSQ